MLQFFDCVRNTVQSRSSQPVVTWISNGGRIELSAVTLANGISKAANLLRDQCEIASGSHVFINLPVHWQTSVWLGAAHSVSSSVVVVDVQSDLRITSDPGNESSAHTETGVVSLDPFGRPVEVKDPFLINLSADVRMHPDQFMPTQGFEDEQSCIRDGQGDLLWADLETRVSELADQFGIETGTKFAISELPLTIDAALLYCAVPLLTGSSVILLDSLGETEIDKALAQENCTLHISL